MKRELKDIVKETTSLIDLKEGDIALDIGANDGTMLDFFDDSVITIGCEPANNLVDELAKKCKKVIHDFWSKEAFIESVKSFDKKKAKIISAIGMFYDLDDPLTFVSDIEQSLDDNGIFVAQLMTSAPMIEKNDLGNICHEHIEYYSYKSLVYMLSLIHI